MSKFGLIGKTLKHSFSKNYFTSKFEKLNLAENAYNNFEIDDVSSLKELIQKNELLGLNVTIPHKESVLTQLDELDEISKQIGAVNTIVVGEKHKKLHLKGYNTDVVGFKNSMKPFLNTDHERALILGNGGAAKAIKYVLEEYGIPYLVVTRNPLDNNEISWDNVNEFVIKYHQLIINTTPLGMFPDVDEKPEIPYGELTTKHFLFDLIYNPIETEFMRLGKLNGAMAINGLSMLQHQADKAWEIWQNAEDYVI